MVYWNTRSQPPAEDRIPVEKDSISAYPFTNKFTFSVDVYVTKLTDTDVSSRIILYKTVAYGTGLDLSGSSSSAPTPNPSTDSCSSSLKCPTCPVTSPVKHVGASGSPLQGSSVTIPDKPNTTNGQYSCNAPNSFAGLLGTPLSNKTEGFADAVSLVLPSMNKTTHSTQNMLDYMSKISSMVLYLTEVNDLVLTFFVGKDGTAFHSRPIKNVPLYKPFRVSVVVEEKLFTIYLNGKHAFQRVFPSNITNNGSISLTNSSKTQRFYSRPAWSGATGSSSQTVFVQNLHIWPRIIPYTEVQKAQPALAAASDFNIPAAKDETCSQTTTSYLQSAYNLIPKFGS
jgi:hypothetical protein